MRTSARVTGAAVALAAALFASGCGSDSDSDDDKGDSSPSAEETSGSEDGDSTDVANLKGGWLAKDGDPKLVLGIGGKDKVSLAGVGASGRDESVQCQGTVEGEKIDLTCEKGDYSEGTIQESSEKSLTVKWNTGDSTDFVKSPEGDVPTGAPTNLPSDVPTDVPTDPNDL